ncbi:alanine racemase [Oceanicaulis alexandrii]|uniref:alanine racemase n=1 Tax=Oceanicaulis alexandrii TaxID=153233 RepID=UPI0004013130|nr:alanine racemase [Oceanicaulis alexandrii]
MSVLATPSADNTRARLIVDLDAVSRNFKVLQKLSPNAETSAVVKANAYGLGAGPVARRLMKEGARTFFVATVEEGVEVREALGDATPDIWVFSGYRAKDRPLYAKHRLGAVLNQPGETAQFRADPVGPCAVHIDTGMARLGYGAGDISGLLTALQALDVSMVMSHLACSEETASAQNIRQLERFTALTNALPETRLSLANTGGVLLDERYHFDLTRPGIGLYGATADLNADNPFEPAMTLQAPILQLREIDAGDTVGYGATYVAHSPRLIATVAAGYADGLPRALWGSGCARINGLRAPIVGKLSMDLTMIDVTGLEHDIAQGAVPEFFGPDLYQAAALDGTLPYEILTGLGARAERIYKGAP